VIVPGTLRSGSFDLTSPSVLGGLLDALTALVKDPRNHFVLQLRDRYHFRILGVTLPETPGWYVICDPGGMPLYVGTAEDLNARLNTDNGSRDGFANPQRTSDPERNFIKAFLTAGLIKSLSVVVITEDALRQELSIEALDKLDRQNLEKIISIFRARLLGLAIPDRGLDAQQGAPGDAAR
jgi:hypothetical protein